MRFLLLLLILPFLELWAMIVLGREIGVLPTVAVVLGAGVGGAALARFQGMRVLQRLSAESRAGRRPTLELVDGAGLLVAGGLLLLPGLISDVLGLLLLVPPIRRFLVFRALGWGQQKVAQGMRDGTITVHAVRLDPDQSCPGSPDPRWPSQLSPPRDPSQLE